MTTTFNGHTLETFNDASFDANMSFNPNMHSTQPGPSHRPGGDDYYAPDNSFAPMATSATWGRNAWGNPDVSGISVGSSMSEDTAQRIALLQRKLSQKLGPEFLSTRAGPGGSKLTYVEGWKVINLANEVFGFNGWSSSIVRLSTDFVDFDVNRKTFNVGVTAIMRVTLRDGTYHEDLGYGILENARSKGAALDKCKKEAVTDGLKRALRHFGNVMGNCLYDRSFTAEVTKIKAPPAVKLSENELHRRNQDPSLDISVSSNGSSANHPPQAQGQARPSAPRAPNPPINPTTSRPIPPPQPQPPKPSVTFAPQPSARAGPSVPAPAPAPTTSAATTKPPQLPSKGFDSDDYDFLDADDELFANADLGPAISGDADMGRPLEHDVDMGRPIDHDEGLGATRRPPVPNPDLGPAVGPGNRQLSTGQDAADKNASAAARRKRIYEALAAAAASESNDNGDSTSAAASTSTSTTTVAQPVASTSSSSTAHIPSNPPTTNAPPVNSSTLAQQRYQRYASLRDQNLDTTKTGITPVAHNESVTYQTGAPGMSGGSGVGVSGVAGMKRPAEAMMGPPNPRSMRPGMGLQHASASSSSAVVAGVRREVLGLLDVSDSGDVKRIRR